MSIDTLITAFAGVLGGGLGVALVNYVSTRRKSDAEARNISITGEITLSQGYQQLVRDIRKQLEDFESKYDKEMARKDAQIKVLQDQVTSLQLELAKYQNTNSRAEDARQTLHQTVDKKIDEIKEPIV